MKIPGKMKLLAILSLLTLFIFYIGGCTSKGKNANKEPGQAASDSIKIFRELTNKMRANPASATAVERQRMQALVKWFQINKVPARSVFTPEELAALNPQAALAVAFKNTPKKNLDPSDSLGIFHNLYQKGFEDPTSLSAAERERLRRLAIYVQTNNIPLDSIFTPEEIQIMQRARQQAENPGTVQKPK